MRRASVSVGSVVIVRAWRRRGLDVRFRPRLAAWVLRTDEISQPTVLSQIVLKTPYDTTVQYFVGRTPDKLLSKMGTPEKTKEKFKAVGLATAFTAKRRRMAATAEREEETIVERTLKGLRATTARTAAETTLRPSCSSRSSGARRR